MHRTRILAGAGALALGGSLLGLTTASATAPPPTLRVSPTAAVAGQPLAFTAYCAGNAGTVTSPGLVAPVSLTRSGSHFTGTGKAGDRPGRYQASFTCSGSGGPAGDGTVTVRFSIACTPPSSAPSPTRTTTRPPSTSSTPPTTSGQPSTTEPPASATPAASVRCGQSSSGGGTPPQVKIRPRGAPETGDGSAA
ncbi:hypothetical protein HNR02_004775 [Amycolatopsis endophytica]|uniref:Ig-like domain-containing protein n=1 Tax=Amycolatopsis endophytica TaxID=860233 RepID=A0A853B9L4_9PSEU|nr:hypothetical protein [Amycolatopsis endophytica]NYI91452.1 hypothetical protein [Amycolatopsis endophytica]